MPRWLAAGPSLTIRLAAPESICAVTFSSDRTGDAGDHGVANFVADYQLRVSRDGNAWQPVADSRDRRPINEAHRKQRLRDAAMTATQRLQLEQYQQQLAQVQARINAVAPLEEWWVGQFQPAPGRSLCS